MASFASLNETVYDIIINYIFPNYSTQQNNILSAIELVCDIFIVNISDCNSMQQMHLNNMRKQNCVDCDEISNGLFSLRLSLILW